MIEEQARDEIAFIRRAIEEGGSYAAACGTEMVVWGVAVAIGYGATYAFVRGWSPLSPGIIWTAAIALPWLYSLRCPLRRFFGRGVTATRGPMAHALRMLWLGCGTFLTTLALAAVSAGAMREGWFNAVAAGVLGIAFFASAWLSNIAWLRWAAVGWWAGELVLFSLRSSRVVLPIAAFLMLLLLAGPGIFLAKRREAGRAR